MEFRYFSAVEGRAFERPGTRTLVGCSRGPDGYEWDERVVTRVPVEEVERYATTYQRALAWGDLRERAEEDWHAYQAGLEDTQPPPAVDAAEPAGPQAAEAGATPGPRRKRR